MTAARTALLLLAALQLCSAAPAITVVRNHQPPAARNAWHPPSKTVGFTLMEQEDAEPDCDETVVAPTPLPNTFCPVGDPPQMHMPTSVHDQRQEAHLTVFWEPMDATFNVTAYSLEQSIDNKTFEQVYYGKDLSWDTFYYTRHIMFQYRVKGINCASGSPWSHKLTLLPTKIWDAPRPPFTTEVTPTSVGIGWFLSIDNPNSLTLLEYRRADGPLPEKIRGNDYADWQGLYTGIGDHFNANDLRVYTWYWFRVAYFDGENTHAYSKPLAVQTKMDVPRQLDMPTMEWITEVGTPSLTKARVSMFCSHSGGIPIESYTLAMASEEDEAFRTVYFGKENSTVLELRPGTSYAVRAYASNALGQSEESRALVIVCPPSPPHPPAAPVLISKTSTLIKLKWAPPAFNGGNPIHGYALGMGEGRAIPMKEIKGGEHQMFFDHTETGLKKYTYHRFRVLAINDIGRGEWSEPLIVQTKKVNNVCPGGEPSTEACFNHGQCNLYSQSCGPCYPSADGSFTYVLDDCSGIPCPDNCTDPTHGKCDYTTGTCNCIDPYQGAACDKQDLSHLCPPSCHHGYCDILTANCTCDEGYAGTYCDEYDCTMLGQCHGHGTCVAVGVCECDKGWINSDCAKADCSQVNECTYHGECVLPQTCKCDPAWAGEDCSYTACPGECNGHGTCIGPNMCDCVSEWQNFACQDPVCQTNCSGHGDCVDPDECVCWDGWEGFDCPTALCPNVGECNGNGHCILPDVCNCTGGYTGEDCTKFSCEADCNSNGICLAPDDCMCHEGWFGSACGDARCDEVDQCFGNGRCASPQICTCNEGWGGTRCEEAKCDLVEYCSGHGQCVSPQVCGCDGGYAGDKCQERTEDTNALLFNEAVDSMDLGVPILNGLLDYTLEGWFNIQGVSARVMMIRQDEVLELYCRRRFPSSRPAPLDELGNPYNPIVMGLTVKTNMGEVFMEKQISSRVGKFHYIAVVVQPITKNPSNGKEGQLVQLFMDGGVIDEKWAMDLRHSVKSEYAMKLGGGVMDPRASEKPRLEVATFRVWNTARAILDIQTSMLAGNMAYDIGYGKYPDSLIAFYKFADKFGFKAVDATGNQLPARLVSQPEFGQVAIPEVTAPSPPLMVEHVVINTDTVQILWEAPWDDGGATVFEYQLEQSVDFIYWDIIYTGPDQEFEVTDLGNNPYSQYRVLAENFDGRSNYSETLLVTTTPAPPTSPPTGPALVYTSQTSMHIIWARPKANGGLLRRYDVEMADVRDGTPVPAVSRGVEGGRSAFVWGLLPGQEYRVRVRGVNDYGLGEWSNVTYVNVSNAEPSAPQWLRPERTSNSIELRWEEPNPNGSPVLRYKVERACMGPRPFTYKVSEEMPFRMLARHRKQSSLLLLDLESGLGVGDVDMDLPEDVGLAWIDLSPNTTINATLSYLDTQDVEPANRYMYRMQAINLVGHGPWTELYVETDSTSPDPPANLTVGEIKESSTRVTWQTPKANGDPVSTYRLEIANTEAILMQWKTAYEGASWTVLVEGLTGGTQYALRVRAGNCKGFSAASNVRVFSTEPDLPDTPNSFYMARLGHDTMTFTWTPARKNDLENALNYVIEASAVDVPWQEVYFGNLTTAVATGLRPATTYKFRLRAVNSVGAGPPTNVTVVQTLPGPPSIPTEPVIVDALENPQSISMQFKIPAGNGQCVNKMQVLYGTVESGEHDLARELDVDCAAQVGGALDPWYYNATIRGLKPQHKYSFRVRAINDAGSSPTVEAVANTSLVTPPAPMPPTVKAKSGDSVTLQWFDMADFDPSLAAVALWNIMIYVPAPGTPPEQVMRDVYDKETPWEQIYSGVSRSKKVTELMANTTYYFKIYGVNGMGATPHSQPMSCSPTGAVVAPDTPANLQFSVTATTSISLGWTADFQDYTNSPITEFVVERSQAFPHDSVLDGVAQGKMQPPWDEDASRTMRLSGTEGEGPVAIEAYRGPLNAATITGLEAGRSYGFRVRAIGNAGESVPSPYITYHTRPTYPSRILVPRLTMKSDVQIGVEWDRPVDAGSPVTSYRVLINQKGIETSVPVGLQKSFTLRDLFPGSTHKIKIAASNAEGESVGLEGVFQTLGGPPSPPGKAEIVSGSPNELGEPTLRLKWTASIPGGVVITGYTLEMQDPVTKLFEPVVVNQMVLQAHVEGGLLPGITYTFRQFAHSSGGVSVKSPLSSYTVPTQEPSKVLVMTPREIAYDSAMFEWGQATDANEYELYVGETADSTAQVYKGFANEFTVRGLERGKENMVMKVRATNDKGEGPWSEEYSFTMQKFCTGDDGKVCSGRGECKEGRCKCYQRYEGNLCQLQVESAVCAAWGGGHHITFDNQQYVSHAVGEHLLYGLSDVGENTDWNGLRVFGFYSPLSVTLQNLTAISSVALVGDKLSGGKKLIISADLTGAISISTECGAASLTESITGDEVDTGAGFFARYDESPSPRYTFTFKAAFGYPGNRHPPQVVVQAWPFQTPHDGAAGFLNVYVVHTGARVAKARGMCGMMTTPESPALEQWHGGEGLVASTTWVEQWHQFVKKESVCPLGLKAKSKKLTQSYQTGQADTKKNKDKSSGVVKTNAVAMEEKKKKRQKRLAMSNLMQVDRVAELRIPGAVCPAGDVDEAKTTCVRFEEDPPTYHACIVDNCIMRPQELGTLLAPHLSGAATIKALDEQVFQAKVQAEIDENAAAEKGLVTGGQDPLPICPK